MSSEKRSIKPVGIFASLPRTVRARSLVLNGDPKKKNFLYTNGNNVIIRDINNPELQSEIVTKHAKPVNVAQYSPTGFYIASADESGKVIIWDTINPEHINKNECQPFTGPVKDLAWDSRSKCIAVCGEGREKCGGVFTYDTGNSVGVISGTTKPLNSIDFKPNLPYRIAAACEDHEVYYYDGPPFKFKSSSRDHSSFVNVVRFSPSGDVFISGSTDKRAIIFDGKTGEVKAELIDPSVGKTAHNGGIYALSFNDDGSKVITCSGDKTAKIWDVNTQQVLTTFKMGSAVEDMQLGCLWQGEHIITISLSGYINYLDQDHPDTPIKIIKGTNKPITCMAVNADRSRVYTGSSDSHINFMDVHTFESDDITGKPHGSQINDMVIDGQKIITVSMDDTIKFSDEGSGIYSESIKLDSQPRGVDSKYGVTIVACMNHAGCLGLTSQQYFSHIEMACVFGWRKTGVPGEKPLTCSRHASCCGKEEEKRKLSIRNFRSRFERSLQIQKTPRSNTESPKSPTPPPEGNSWSGGFGSPQTDTPPSLLPAKLNFDVSPVTNAKGYPTVAAKQPRKRPLDAASDRCDNCLQLQQRIVVLTRQLEDMKKEQNGKDAPENISYARPKPGMYTKEDIPARNGVLLFREGNKTNVHPVKYEPKQVAISPSGEIAISGQQDKSIHIYQISGEELMEQKCVSFEQVAVALEYSPDGKYLAVAGAERSVACFDVTDYSQMFDSKIHTSRVNCVSWNPISTMFATGSIDTNTAIFLVDETRRSVPNYALFKAAHPQNQITAVRWIDDVTFMTGGQDSNVKKWRVESSCC